MPDPHTSSNVIAAQRSRVRRTAWMLALVALLVYAGFILTGVLGK